MLPNKKQYQFISNDEPTDEQLNMIMIDMIKAVQEKAKKTNEQFWLQHNVIVQAAIQNKHVSK